MKFLFILIFVGLVQVPGIQGQLDPDGVEHYSSQAVEDEGLSCYALGYLYGRIVMRRIYGLYTNPEYDSLVVPKRCKEKIETKTGMADGIKSVVVFINSSKRGRY